MDESRARAVAARAVGGRRWWRGPRLLVSLMGVVFSLSATLALVVRHQAHSSTFLLALAAGSPYLMLGAPLGLVVFSVTRNIVGAVVSVVCTCFCVATQAPLFVAASRPNGHVIVVMTSNLRIGQGDPRAVVASVTRRHVELLMLQELTPRAMSALHSAGLDAVLPHHIADARQSYGGTGLWSRYPLSEAHARSDFTYAFVTATASPGAGAPAIQVAALHLAGPVPVSDRWRADIALLAAVLRAMPGRLPTIVAGDFNATRDTAQFRALLRDGFHDAADQAGAGITATYPADIALPPLVALDHVVTRNVAATSVATVTIGGSDHRAVVARLVVP